MPIDGRLLRRFQTLKDSFESALRDHQAREDKRGRGELLIDPLDIDPLLIRWQELYADLCAADPELSDVPAPVPLTRADNPSAYEGRGGFEVARVRRLQRALEEAWTLVTHPSKQLAQVSLDREGIFLAGQPFDAMLAVTSIIRDATQSVVVIDGYVSERTLDLLTKKAPGVGVQMLTKKDKSVKPGFVVHAKAFATQYGPLEIRTSQTFHDRFIVIDGTHCFHFGTSLKDAAIKNTFMFSKIEEPAVVDLLKNAFAADWTAGEMVAL